MSAEPPRGSDPDATPPAGRQAGAGESGAGNAAAGKSASASAGQKPEAWLRGPVPGVPPALQPVAHALVQALEDVERLCDGVEAVVLWERPGGAASAGFHLRHMAGSLDRLLAYARGEALSGPQRAALEQEKQHAPHVGATELVSGFRAVVERALDQLRATGDDVLDEPRAVGRDRLPSSVRGLLHHAAEHTARHAGQLATTLRVISDGRRD
jgi:uncharacterized damage-inducible protein DinB